MALQPEETILNGKYRILKLIGEGSFARVWKAEEPGFGHRLVAIKELKSPIWPMAGSPLSHQTSERSMSVPGCPFPSS